MAKKFNFSLENVLKLRSQQVEEARLSLNNAVKIRLQKEEMIKIHHHTIEESRENIAQKGKADNYQATVNHVNFLENEITKIRKEVEDIKKIESIRRDKLNSAMKDEKMMSKLKEKKFDEHKEVVLKEENNIMDEIALRRTNGFD